MWLMLPLPEVAKEYLSGFAFSTAMNSFRSFAGKFGFTAITLGITAMLVTGANCSTCSPVSGAPPER